MSLHVDFLADDDLDAHGNAFCVAKHGDAV